MGLYLEKIVVIACVIAAVIISIVICCFIYENFVSRQHLKWDVCSRTWVSEEERVEIPDIGGHTGVDRRGLNRQPVGDFNLPSREAQHPPKQWDGRAWAAARDAESSQQQFKNTRNVIIRELGRSGGQGGDFRGSFNRNSTGDNNLPSREAQHPPKQWDGRAWAAARDAESSQQQFKNTRNVVIGELGHSGRQGREYMGKSTGDHNLPSRAPQLKNQEELTQQVKLKAPVPSAPALLEPKKPITSQSGQTCCVCMTQNIEIIFNCAHAAT